VAYAKGDSEFNESFAVAVELEGLRRWIAAHGGDKVAIDSERARERRVSFTNLVLKYRNELHALYSMQMPPDAMRARKAAAFAALKDEYLALKAQWGGFAGYDRFFNTVNNANLASVAIYHALVPQFQRMLARHGGDLEAFYAEVKSLAHVDKDARARALDVGASIVAPLR
jgi:predicted aminopeptidase